MPRITTTGHGRTKLPPPTAEQKVRDSGANCAKCRNLTIRNEVCKCAKQLPIGSATTCEAFSDASRERDFRPFFDYNLWLRR